MTGGFMAAATLYLWALGVALAIGGEWLAVLPLLCAALCTFGSLAVLIGPSARVIWSARRELRETLWIRIRNPKVWAEAKRVALEDDSGRGTRAT